MSFFLKGTPHLNNSTRSYAGRALSHLAPTGLSQVHTHYGFKQAIQLRIIISSYGHLL